MIPGGNATLKSAIHTREQNDMRLAIATTDFPPMRGGIAALFSTLARACSERSHLTVLAPWSQTANIFDGQQPYRVIRIPGPPLLREAAFLRQLFSLDQTEGLDAVACASWFPAGLVGYLLWVWHRVPYLVWAHGSDIVDDWRTPRRVVKSGLWPLKRLVLRHCTAVVANSSYTKTLVSEQGVSPGRIHVIPPAVDTNRFTPSPPSRAEIAIRPRPRHGPPTLVTDRVLIIVSSRSRECIRTRDTQWCYEHWQPTWLTSPASATS
jgi:phosphatidylinositol alpha-1,6-mannosyltransferase